jgi:hypothetical protein
LRGKGQSKARKEVKEMKNISALVATLLLIIGLSAGTEMANDHEMSDEDFELEQAFNDSACKTMCKLGSRKRPNHRL